jgi:hypothetical protein
MIQRENDESCILLEDKHPQFSECTSLSYISRLLTLNEKKAEFIKPNLPRSLDIIPKSNMKVEKPIR